METAKQVFVTYNETKTRGFASKPSYWIERGFDMKQAIEMARQYQVEQAQKSAIQLRGRPDITPSQVGFWIASGYTQEEARLRVSSNQSRGLTFYARKYGAIEGRKRWRERNQRWRETLREAEEHDPTIASRRLVSCARASKESMNVFLELSHWCDTRGLEHFVGYGEKKEWFLRSEQRDIFWYDFTIPSKKVIIEYNGSRFHPNPKMTVTERAEWRCLFSDIDAEEKERYDAVKNEVAMRQGYTVLVIWDDEPIGQALTRVKSFIEVSDNQ